MDSKKCPKCGSDKTVLVDPNAQPGVIQDYNRNKAPERPKIPQYLCENCKESFFEDEINF